MEPQPPGKHRLAPVLEQAHRATEAQLEQRMPSWTLQQVGAAQTRNTQHALGFNFRRLGS